MADGSTRNVKLGENIPESNRIKSDDAQLSWERESKPTIAERVQNEAEEKS